MPFRPECGSWSHYVGLLFAHWPDFGCLLSMNSTLANSSCDCGQVFANSTRANSDLGGSILAKKTLTKAPEPLELDKLADCCMIVPKALAASHDLANCLPLANC